MKNYIIPIFIPHYGCPHMCVFCNQSKITGIDTKITEREIINIIDDKLRLINQPRHIEVAFYGGSFTALSLKKQKELLRPAYCYLKKKLIHAIRISTRPDYINKEILYNLQQFGVGTIELGVQSLVDRVLNASNRGHNKENVIFAIEEIRKTNIKLGIQLMPGLPGDNLKYIMKTVNDTIKMRPDFVRIYPTVVLVNTQLAIDYKQNKFKPLGLERAVRYCAIMKLLFEHNHISVIRTGLQATETLDCNGIIIDGPYHPAFGEMVDAYLFCMLITKFLEKIWIENDVITIYHHVKDTSKIRGLKNTNIKYWYKLFNLQKIYLKPDLKVKNRITILYRGMKYDLSKNMIIDI